MNLELGSSKNKLRLAAATLLPDYDEYSKWLKLVDSISTEQERIIASNVFDNIDYLRRASICSEDFKRELWEFVNTLKVP